MNNPKLKLGELVVELQPLNYVDLVRDADTSSQKSRTPAKSAPKAVTEPIKPKPKKTLEDFDDYLEKVKPKPKKIPVVSIANSPRILKIVPSKRKDPLDILTNKNL